MSLLEVRMVAIGEAGASILNDEIARNSVVPNCGFERGGQFDPPWAQIGWISTWAQIGLTRIRRASRKLSNI